MITKLMSVEDLKFLKEINALPSEYALIIQRDVKHLTKIEDWEESVSWFVDDDRLDTDTGYNLIFNHLLTIINCLISNDDILRDQFIRYLSSDLNLGVLDNDSNFNK